LAGNRPGGLPSRIFWLTVGFVAMFAAVIGVVVPLVPTTPFVLLAAFAFMRSSERLHNWLINHPLFGVLIRDWQQHKAIGRRAKISAVISMVAVFLISAVLDAPGWVLLLQAVILGVIGWYVVSRPSPPE
jgi:uncharacterized membrane protein YbaN (DUF454 family)